MKKISSEVKIGAIVLVTVAIFIYLFNYLKGSDLFTKTDTYHIIYSQINGLQESSPVEINGYQAGVVQSIKFINDGSGRLSVAISVDKNFDLPTGTSANITTATLIAGMKIVLLFGDGPGIYKSGDTIPGVIATSIIDKFSEELEPIKGNITEMISKLDSLVLSLNELFSPEFNSDIQASINNVKNITGNLSEITGSEKEALKSSLEDLSKFTAMLSSNSGELDSTLKNLASISDTLASADLGKTLASLKNSMQTTDSILKNMSKGNGTAGKLMTDDSLYVNLSSSMKSLDQLLQDMKDHPKRYVHFSVFGKKDK
jgi:phospholipid/cholesterol/gamma-HCH transport system substrate-binding protein